MKLKDVFLGVCIVALLASELLLFSANRQKDTALTALSAAKHAAEQAQSDLEQLKLADATAQSTESSRLRTDNQNLSQKNSQLQNENSQLRKTNQQLTQQLQTISAGAQQQQQQLQELQTENQAVQQSEAAVERNTCINNLRQIDAAKQQWALENGKTADAIPTEQDLLPYFKDGVFPVCPSGGIYTINAVGLAPTCSIPGHALPQ
jgi:hypothetical protein